MGVVSDAAFSPGERFARSRREMERQVRQNAAARTLEAATIGAGGLRIKDGGDLIVEDVNGATVELATLAFGNKIKQLDITEDRSTATFGDLATVGPVVSDVFIGTAGRCKVMVTCEILDPAPIAGGHGGYMSFEVTGASSVSPSSSNSVSFAAVTVDADAFLMRATRTVLLEQLETGLHTFTAKYRSAYEGQTCSFQDRVLEVEPF